MSRIDELFLIGRESTQQQAVESGTEQIICGPELCGASTLTVYRKTVLAGRRLAVNAGVNYHLIYVSKAASIGELIYREQVHDAEAGAGILLAPGEQGEVRASSGVLELLHLVVPKPPGAVEDGLPGGPGYFFNRKTLRALSDASGGRIRRFCAESSVRLRTGDRLTLTNAIQAGEMHYLDGGASPYHVHAGTKANPTGAAHAYITFDGRGVIEVEGEFRDVEPDTLVFIPPGVPHRLRARGGPLDYFEVQAWRSFKTSILSEEPLGLKWFYERSTPGEALVEWNQS
jgi:mannose-6-phosphate isomerase-like protein (cupin superfamily)